MAEEVEEKLEKKEDEEDSIFQRIDPFLLKWVTVITVLMLFYLHYFTDAERNTKLAIIGVALIMLYINSKQAVNVNAELTCEESVISLDKHIHWWGKRDPIYKDYKIYPDADVTEFNDVPKYWLHTILFRKKIGVATLDEWYLGKTEAYSPAKPRMFKCGRRPTHQDLREIKEFLLSSKHDALKEKGLLKENVLRELIGR